MLNESYQQIHRYKNTTNLFIVFLFFNLVFIQLGLRLSFLITIILIILYTFFILFILEFKKSIKINISYVYMWLFFFFFIGISLYFSASIKESLVYIVKLFSVFLGCIYIFNIILNNKENELFIYRIQFVFKGFFYIFIAVTILGYLFFNQYIDLMAWFLPDSFIEKIIDSYNNNRFGGLGIAAGTNSYIIIFLSFLGNIYNNKSKPLTIINFLLIFSSILISGTRSPIIVWGITLLIFYLLNEKKNLLKLKKMINFFFGLMILIPLLYLVLISDIELRSLDFIISESVYQRFDLYEYAIKQFIDSNGMGIGINNISVLSSIDNGVGRLQEVTNTHNIYLQILAETGIGGFVVLLSFIVYTIILDFKIVNYYKDIIWLKGVATTSIVFWLYGLVSNPLYDYQILFLFFISKSILIGFISNKFIKKAMIKKSKLEE